MINRDRGQRGEFPEIKESFTYAEAIKLGRSYRKDPSDVLCPTCGSGHIEVLAFIEPEIDTDGFATESDPDGIYTAALYCHCCKKGIGLLLNSYGSE